MLSDGMSAKLSVGMSESQKKGCALSGYMVGSRDQAGRQQDAHVQGCKVGCSSFWGALRCSNHGRSTNERQGVMDTPLTCERRVRPKWKREVS